MPTIKDTNTQYLDFDSQDPNDKREVMIAVDNVSMVFNMASEQLNSLKEYFIALTRGELRFKELRALDHVSFEVRRGDVFGIIGTNGSGKSTMLKIVAGVLDPSEGTYTVNGNIAPLIELGAGFDFDLTARENIFLNGALLGYPKPFIEEHFQEIVDFAEVESFLDMPMKNYSSGMVARIAFAIATVIVPEILIVDEVLAVGDFMFQQKCERRIQKLIRDHGVTVLIVSHSNDQIERLCNKAIWIEKGHTRAIGDSRDVCGLYRALGGRIGSVESEEKIMRYLRSDGEVAKSMQNRIAGEDHFGTVLRLNERIDTWSKDVIVISNECVAHAMLATSLSSVLCSARILLSRQTDIPEIALTLARTNDCERAFVLGDETVLNPRVDETLREISTIDEVRRVGWGDAANVSCEVYQIGTETSTPWGRTAIVCSEAVNYGVFTAMPLIMKERIPVLLTPSSGEFSDRQREIFDSGAFDTVIFMEGPDVYSDEVLDGFEQKGIATQRVWGTHIDAYVNVEKWLRSLEAEGRLEKSTKRYMVSTWNIGDAYVMGPLLHQENARLLLHDPYLLDSMARMLDYPWEEDVVVDELTFVENGEINDTDRKIIGRSFTAALREK